MVNIKKKDPPSRVPDVMTDFSRSFDGLLIGPVLLCRQLGVRLAFTVMLLILALLFLLLMDFLHKFMRAVRHPCSILLRHR